MENWKVKLLTASIIGVLLYLVIGILVFVLDLLQSDDPLSLGFGIFIAVVVLFIALLLFRESKIQKILTRILGRLIIVPIAILWTIPLIYLAYLPFTDTDLSLDLGILILKSGFVKFILLSADIFLFYLTMKWIKKRINQKK